MGDWTPPELASTPASASSPAIRPADPGWMPPEIQAAKQFQQQAQQKAQDIPAFPNQASDEDDQQREIDTGAGMRGAGLAAGVVAGEALPAVLGAARAAKIAAKVKELNDAQDAAHIGQVAEAVARQKGFSGMADTEVSTKIDALLKDSQQASIRTPQVPGQPSGGGWPTGQPPVAPQDISAVPTGAAAGATDAAAKSAARALLKNPWFWSSVLPGGGYGAYGIYHAAKTLGYLKDIFE
jgi:hypothetical protein